MRSRWGTQGRRAECCVKSRLPCELREAQRQKGTQRRDAASWREERRVQTSFNLSVIEKDAVRTPRSSVT